MAGRSGGVKEPGPAQAASAQPAADGGPQSSQAHAAVEAAIAEAREVRRAKRFEQAAQILLDALDHRVRADSLFFHLGNVYVDAGDLQRAEYAYRRAVEINPRHANAHHNLGVVYKRLGQVAKSVEAQRTAVRVALTPGRSEGPRRPPPGAPVIPPETVRFARRSGIGGLAVAAALIAAVIWLLSRVGAP